ncbi:MAG: isopeptide-forming domain-containing fimbrial protein [Ruminococcus sp.]|uniref:isopeptide-forming domain-containing fimbrial protein n=1 Tax=Ruminococcus sp. TaxID=41978 RepID=UPI0025D16E54|nr:isopeptide-forming domain-containing fimbrial protein [Ruminococcus sp.]MCR4795436.1 isopeptide-forming domain-containing fimbrial protein [Ruminococcus sp.]
MKNNKRFLALMTAGFLAITPMAATCMTAVAAGTSTLTVTDSDTVEHDYKAYQIITGTESGGKLTGLAWGDGVNSASLIAALTNSDNVAALGITASEVGSTPESVAAVLSKITEGDKLQKLAKIIASCIDSTNAIDLVKSETSYSASSLEHGWYLVLDESTLGSNTSDVKVRSANILKFTGDTTINSKHSLPTLNKVIIDGGDKEVNTASIGDTVTYEIRTTVPDMTGYDKYFFVVDDTLSKGLTYDNNLTISYGSTAPYTPLTLDTDGAATTETGDYYVTPNPPVYNSSTGTTIKIVFEDFYNKFKSVEAGTPIVITYTATLNNAAVINGTGNENTASLTYSNDPNVSTDGKNETGKPDEPNSSAPTGKTPDDTVKTFTTSIVIDKYELGDTSKKLSGVKFRISGTGLKSVFNESGLYVKNNTADPAYYLLKNGTYTNEEPSGDSTHDAAYASTTDKYEYTATASITGTPVKVNTYGETDANGALTFSGLNAGTYIITEVEAKDGYNLLTAPIKVEISETLDQTGKTCSYTYSKDGGTASASNVIQIANAAGATLPTTGGIGTKLFYIIGGLLVAGSVVLLVTKKRMSTKED